MEASHALLDEPSQNNSVTVLTLRVCDCPQGEHVSTRDAHPQYTGATISSVLTLAGLKPRHAYRIRDSLFAALADAVQAAASPSPVALLESVCLPNRHWSVTIARQELVRTLMLLLDSDARAILGGEEMLRVACRYTWALPAYTVCAQLLCVEQHSIDHPASESADRACASYCAEPVALASQHWPPSLLSA